MLVILNGCKHPSNKKHGNNKQVSRNYEDNCTRGNGQISDNQNSDNQNNEIKKYILAFAILNLKLRQYIQ